MIFNDKNSFIRYIKSLDELGFGSQGITYHDFNSGKAIKVFHEFFENEEVDQYWWQVRDILKFGDFTNETYVFPEQKIMVEGRLVGYISRFVNGKVISTIDPLKVNLDKLIKASAYAIKDIRIISQKKILTYDVMYNIMYGMGKFHVIDTDEYCYSDKDYKLILHENNVNFNMGIMYFLVDNLFNEFVEKSKILSEMYDTRDCDILEFLMELKKQLSEYVGCDIKTLSQAKSCLNKLKRKSEFIRGC